MAFEKKQNPAEEEQPQEMAETPAQEEEENEQEAQAPAAEGAADQRPGGNITARNACT